MRFVFNLLDDVKVLGAAGTDGSNGGPESSSSSSDEFESNEELLERKLSSEKSFNALVISGKAFYPDRSIGRCRKEYTIQSYGSFIKSANARSRHATSFKNEELPYNRLMLVCLVGQ